jgi:hypothetical protein
VDSLKPRPLYPSEKSIALIVHWILGWIGPTQNRSAPCGEEKNLEPVRNRTPAVKPVAHRYTDSRPIFQEQLGTRLAGMTPEEIYLVPNYIIFFKPVSIIS